MEIRKTVVVLIIAMLLSALYIAQHSMKEEKKIVECELYFYEDCLEIFYPRLENNGRVYPMVDSIISRMKVIFLRNTKFLGKNGTLIEKRGYTSTVKVIYNQTNLLGYEVKENTIHVHGIFYDKIVPLGNNLGAPVEQNKIVEELSFDCKLCPELDMKKIFQENFNRYAIDLYGLPPFSTRILNLKKEIDMTMTKQNQK